MRASAAAIVALSVLAPPLATADAAAGPADPGSAADPDRPARAGTTAASGAVVPADLDLTAGGRQLRYGTPRQAGLVGHHLDRLGPDLHRYLEPSPDHPRDAGEQLADERVLEPDGWVLSRD